MTHPLDGDLVGPITPQTPGYFKYVFKLTDHKIRWTLMVVMMPNWHRIQRCTDKVRGFTERGFKKACPTMEVELKFAATATPQQIVVS